MAGGTDRVERMVPLSALPRGFFIGVLAPPPAPQPKREPPPKKPVPPPKAGVSDSVRWTGQWVPGFHDY